MALQAFPFQIGGARLDVSSDVFDHPKRAPSSRTSSPVLQQAPPFLPYASSAPSPALSHNPVLETSTALAS